MGDQLFEVRQGSQLLSSSSVCPDRHQLSPGCQDFGQRVDLCARLREVLLSYAEGSSVLKELIQARAVPAEPCRWTTSALPERSHRHA